MKLWTLGASLLTLGVTALPALAQEGEREGRRGERRQQLLERFDKDGDGELNDEERTAAREAFQRRREGEDRRGRDFNPEQFFARLDQDKNDELGEDELRGRIGERLKEADADENGKISKKEFLAAMERVRGRDGRGRSPNTDQLFAEHDKNKDDKLTAEELPERMARFLLRADADGDKAVTKEELQKARERFEQNRGEDRRRPQSDDNGE